MTSSRRPIPRTVRGRRRLAALAAVLTIAAPGAASETASASAKAGRLTTGTTITWRGNTGMLLDVPSRTEIPQYAARLFLRGGTYAVVRMSPRRAACPPPRCYIEFALDYHRPLARNFDRGHGPGGDHNASTSLDGTLTQRIIPAATYELYLFTDGEATMVFDHTSLPRAPRTYRPRGRIVGGVVPLPTTCVSTPVPCNNSTGYAGRLRAGGATFDLGVLGSVDFLIASVDAKPGLPQTHSVRGCFDFAEPDPAAHPYGCDAFGTDPDSATYETGNTAIFLANAAMPRGGMLSTDASGHVSGKVYVGHQHFTAHDLTAPAVVAYATWLTYGVR